MASLTMASSLTGTAPAVAARSAKRAGKAARRASPRCSAHKATRDETSVGPMDVLSRAAKTAVVSVTAAAMITSPAGAFEAQQAIPELAGLEANPISNSKALLRYALPINNKPIREIQRKLESISDDLRVPGVRFSGAESSVNGSAKIASDQAKKILDAAAGSKQDDAKAALKELQSTLEEFKTVVAQKDKQEVPYQQQKALSLVGRIEQDMIPSFPFEVPKPYDTRPLLKGRATVEMNLKVKDNTTVDTGSMLIVLDGFNAPVSAGNWVDLINRGFYNGMEIQRSDGFVVQSGKPSKGAKNSNGDGFVDPATGEERNVPLEIMVAGEGDKVPEYDFTLEELGRYRAEPVLPFNAFGTLAMARREADNNSASSQFFFLLKESELTPSGTNILDGRYGVFGYVIEGQELLRDLKVGDVITSINVIDGGENLVNGYDAKAAAAAPADPAADDA